MLMMLAYYRWGNWRKAHMLPAQAAIPAAEPAREQTPAAEQAEAPWTAMHL